IGARRVRSEWKQYVGLNFSHNRSTDHTDNREGFATESEELAHGINACEPALPKPVADDGNAGPSRAVLARRESRPHDGICAEESKIIRTDMNRSHLFGRIDSGQVDPAGDFIRCNLIEHVVLLSKNIEFGHRRSVSVPTLRPAR